MNAHIQNINAVFLLADIIKDNNWLFLKNIYPDWRYGSVIKSLHCSSRASIFSLLYQCLEVIFICVYLYKNLKTLLYTPHVPMLMCMCTHTNTYTHAHTQIIMPIFSKWTIHFPFSLFTCLPFCIIIWKIGNVIAEIEW